MTAGEIISIIAVVISFFGATTAFYFAMKKQNKEQTNEESEQNHNMKMLRADVAEIKVKVEKIDDRMFDDHEKVVEYEARIKNLEKEIFNKKGA